MNRPFKTYDGGKAAAGVHQQIINIIPPHKLYFEPFLGNGFILSMKRKAQVNIGCDLNPEVISAWCKAAYWSIKEENFSFWNVCGIEVLETYQPWLKPDAFVYCDPPYRVSTRNDPQRKLYNGFEMSDDEHVQLVHVLKRLKCNCAISAYPNEIYDELFLHQGPNLANTDKASWYSMDFNARTRQGTVVERIYCNYKLPPPALHDYHYVGKNYSDRQRIDRKVKRHVAGLHRLPAFERNAIVSAIVDEFGPKELS